jgi:N4-gp56 family major capsid protein
MADVLTTATTVDATRMEFIVEMVQRELAAAAKVRPLITDVSQWAVKGNKSIEFPKASSFTVIERADGVAVDAAALTYTTDKLDLNINASVQWLLEKKADIQSRLMLLQANIQRAASAHARAVDTKIIQALFDGAAGANDVSYTPLTIENNLLDVVEKMDEANVPEEGRILLFRPEQKKLLLGIENLIQTNRYGSSEPILKGEIGMAYGLKFVMSNNTSADFVDGVMLGFHKESAAIGFQLDPLFDEESDIKYGAGAKRYALDQLYGVKVLQGGNLIVKVS